jgi:cyclophilin family peptidyl-prolyl cis-trans isomerase
MFVALWFAAWSGQTTAEAEWTRDVDALLGRPVEADELVALAVALGRQRDARCLPLLERLASAGTGDPELLAAVIDGLGRTPGGESALRSLADALPTPGRGWALRQLGRQGSVGDLPRLLSALGGADRAEAAVALGLLASRGVPGLEAAGPALLEVIDPLRLDGTHAAAFALHRLRLAGQGPTLSPGQAERLATVWSRLTDGDARGWLAPTVLSGLDGARRRAWVVEVLEGPWAQARQALIPALDAKDLSPDGWRGLLVHDDPWVRLRAAERLGAAEVPPEALRRALVAAGEATADERAVVLREALEAVEPAARSASASALLAGASDAERRALAEATDPVVRELVSAEIIAQPGLAPGLLPGLLARGGPASTVRGLVEAAAVSTLGEPERRVIEALAVGGPFGVRGPAAALASTWGTSSVGGARPFPGPPDLERRLEEIGALRGAEVVTTQGRFVIALDPGSAPLGVSAFGWLAARDAFDGNTFHRVVPGFVVQTGDPRGDGMGGPDWMLADEPGPLPFGPGAVGIARAGYDTGSSQWFVTTSDQPHLVGEYTRIGEVVSGLEVVRRLTPADQVLDVVLTREGGP